MAGSDVELELEACGDRLLGRWVGVVLPCEGEGDGLFEDLRLEPTSLFRPALMDDIDRRKEASRRAEVGWQLFNVRLEELGDRPSELCRFGRQQQQRLRQE
jgi:hypothetical protein